MKTVEEILKHLIKAKKINQQLRSLSPASPMAKQFLDMHKKEYPDIGIFVDSLIDFILDE